MTEYNATNERVKRQYFTFLREAKRQSPASVDGAAKALSRFEESTRFRDFKAFHPSQAVAFKRGLSAQKSKRSDAPLSKVTLATTSAHLKRFFLWLADQPGYRSKLKYSDAEYFNVSEKDARVANARRERAAPTLEQVRHVLFLMPHATAVERRNRALIAFTLLTGARDGATASFKLKHLDVSLRRLEQDSRDVKTKNSKSFTTYVCPVGEDVVAILEDWVKYLREDLLWGTDDPLFPATHVTVGESARFEVTGLIRKHWASAAPIRAVFREAFTSAGLPYFNPHSIRKTLAQLGERLCRNAEDFKAWSQNLGHEGVLTTFYSYGAVSQQRQGEILGRFARADNTSDLQDELLQRMLRSMSEQGIGLTRCR
jgi:integrase